MKKLTIFLVLALFFNYLEYGGDFDLSWLFDFSAPQPVEERAVESDNANTSTDKYAISPARPDEHKLGIGSGQVHTSFYDGTLTLRKGPSTHYTALNWLPEDTQFTALLEEQNYKNQTWIYVEVNGQFGWINKDYTNTTYRLEADGANKLID